MAKKNTTTKTPAVEAAKTPPPETKTEKAPANGQVAAPKPKSTKRAPGKKDAPKKAPTARKKPSKPIVRAGFSNEDVALRAYFIAEKRHTAGLPGDEHSDWIEAERQLRKEHGIKA